MFVFSLFHSVSYFIFPLTTYACDVPFNSSPFFLHTHTHTAGIPDDIFPDAWRNDIKKNTCTAAAAENGNEEDQNCQLDNEEEKDEEVDVDPCALYYDDHPLYTDDEQHSDEYVNATDNDNDDKVDAADTLPTNDGHNVRSVSGVIHPLYAL